MWVALVTIAAAAILVFTTTRSRPSAAKVPPAAAVATSNQFLPTIENKNTPPGPAPEGMVWIPGGEFSMGAQDPTDMHDAVGMQATTDSRPVHRVFVDGFWMDATEVTNEQFARFVKATGYVTVAEQTPRAEDFPGAPPESLVPGSVIFTPPDHAVPLTDAYQWWSEVNGASWRHPLGPKSSIAGKERFPVVHIAYADALDALAYRKNCRRRQQGGGHEPSGATDQTRFHAGLNSHFARRLEFRTLLATALVRFDVPSAYTSGSPEGTSRNPRRAVRPSPTIARFFAQKLGGDHCGDGDAQEWSRYRA